MTRKYDVIVWGCTGFTGRLTCKYLNDTYPDLKWAIAGRNKKVLDELKVSLSLNSTVDVLLGDVNDQTSLEEFVSKTTVLLTTAGPFAKIGAPIVNACLKCNTHYCDITGEIPWIRQIIDQHHGEASEKKLRIVNCCGFDCIPSDLGVQMMVEQLQTMGATPQEVRFTAYEVKGGASGGTIHSMLNMFATNSISTLLSLLNPYYLNPRDAQTGKQVPSSPDKAVQRRAGDQMLLDYDRTLGCWNIPYIMQSVDTRLVNRSNALQGNAYGAEFVFTERLRVPGLLTALAATCLTPILALLFLNPLGRSLLRCVVPSPGQGPSQRMQEEGFMKMKMWARGVDKASGKEVLVRGGVTAMGGDPGYRQTAKMVAETAVCLALDQASLPQIFGVLTPASAMGPVLRERLKARGIDFFVDACSN